MVPEKYAKIRVELKAIAAVNSTVEHIASPTSTSIGFTITLEGKGRKVINATYVFSDYQFFYVLFSNQ